MTIGDYTVKQGDNNTLLFTDNYGVTYRVDINNYDVNQHTYIFENARQATFAYAPEMPEYVYSQNITNGNSIGVSFPETFAQVSTNTPSGKYHTTDECRSIVSTSTNNFMKNLPTLISQAKGENATTISNIGTSDYTVISRGWSGGTQPAVELAAATGSKVAVMIDPNRSGADSMTGLEQPSVSDYQTLKNNGAVIVSIKGNAPEHKLITHTEQGAIDNGVPVINVKVNNIENHGALEQFASSTRVDAYLAGAISYDQFVANCKANGYDPNNITFTKITGSQDGKSIEEVIKPEDYSNIVKNNPSIQIGTNYYDPNNYTSNTYKLDTSLGDSTIASSISTVMDAMNGISGAIKNSSVQKVTNECTSSTTIPNAFFDSQNYLMGVNATLSDNIGKETSVIANLAQAFYNLDVKMSEATQGLNGSINGSQVDSLLNQILSTDIKIPAASFSLATSSLENVVQGQAGKLCKSDIESMLSNGKLIGPLANNFEADNKDTHNLLNNIKSFQDTIAANSLLQGDIWKQVNSKLDGYNDLLNMRIESNDKLEAAYEKALNLLNDYMEGYDELDDSRIDEYKTEVVNLKQENVDLQGKIDEMREECTVDSDSGEETCVMIHCYNESERAEFHETIVQNTAKIEELNRLIDKLEGLAEVMNQAANIVNNAVSEIKNDYESKVSDLCVAEPESVVDAVDTTPLDNLSQTPQTFNDTTPVTPVNTNLGSASGVPPGTASSPKPASTAPKPIAVVPTVSESNTPQYIIVQNNDPQPVENIQTNQIGEQDNRPSYGRPSYSESEPIIEEIEEPLAEEPVVEEQIVEEPIIEETTPIQYNEPPHTEQLANEATITMENPNIMAQVDTESASNKLKTAGIMAGAALTTAVAAYEVSKLRNSEKVEEEEYSGDNYYTFTNNIQEENY